MKVVRRGTSPSAVEYWNFVDAITKKVLESKDMQDLGIKVPSASTAPAHPGSKRISRRKRAASTR